MSLSDHSTALEYLDSSIGPRPAKSWAPIELKGLANQGCVVGKDGDLRENG